MVKSLSLSMHHICINENQLRLSSTHQMDSTVVQIVVYQRKKCSTLDHQFFATFLLENISILFIFRHVFQFFFIQLFVFHASDMLHFDCFYYFFNCIRNDMLKIVYTYCNGMYKLNAGPAKAHTISSFSNIYTIECEKERWSKRKRERERERCSYLLSRALTSTHIYKIYVFQEVRITSNSKQLEVIQAISQSFLNDENVIENLMEMFDSSKIVFVKI